MVAQSIGERAEISRCFFFHWFLILFDCGTVNHHLMGRKQMVVFRHGYRYFTDFCANDHYSVDVPGLLSPGAEAEALPYFVKNAPSAAAATGSVISDWFCIESLPLSLSPSLRIV